MMKATPGMIQRSNLGGEVYRVLWERILDRQLQPGQKLSDVHLSDELGVSRTPVREALHRLVQDGIVRAEPNRGFYVASFSARDVAEVYDLRAILETAVVQKAAAQLDPVDLAAALADLDEVETQVRAAATDQERFEAAAAFLATDRGFHRWLAERAGNRRLMTIAEGLWGQIAVFQQAGTHLPGWIDESIGHHRAIIAALLAGQVDEAVTAMEHHILVVKDRVLCDLASKLDPHPSGNGHDAEHHPGGHP